MQRVKVLAVVLGLGTGGAERSLVDMAPLMSLHGVDIEFMCRAQLPGAQSDVAVPVQFSTAKSLVGWTSEIRRRIRRDNPDIVHTQLFQADMAGRVAAIGTSARVVCSLVNMSYEEQRYRDPRVSRWRLETTRMIEASTGRLLVDHFHAITAAVAASASERLHIRPDSITVVPRGRDRARLGDRSSERGMTARRQLGLAADAPVVMTLGREEYQKAHEIALQAVAELSSHRPDVRLIMAGRRGNSSDEIDELIERLGLASRVVRPGHVANVGDLLCAADCLLFPSRFEGLGGALLEAMALETPIVATDIPPIREVVGGEAGAMLVPIDDSGALAAAALAVFEDPDSAACRARSALRRFEDCYTIDSVAAQMANLYRAVANRR